MNLILDVGNTAVKLAIFDGGAIVFYQMVDKDKLAEQVKKVCEHYPQLSHGMVSSVGHLDRKVIAVLSVFCDVHELTPASRTPYKNSYASPRTLGGDRMALATAAFYYNHRGNTLVVDAGTCITYDMVNDFGEYLGGAISPGLRMRYAALKAQTAKLPLLEPEIPFDFVGNSTENGIHSGVVNGICYEIDGFIGDYKSRFRDLTVILTGGDASFLSKRLKNTIFADSKFLLKGLNYLLEYNKH